jgi:ferric-dicitrate binding protein FerR (iron transport regulator)
VRQLPAATQIAEIKVIVKENTGAVDEKVILPDRSLVLLASGSSIRYLEHFDARARNIQLEGRALFEVAKDSARPFTVTARGYATTALGTRFIVDATTSHVSIRLLKGKIVVNATAEGDVAMRNVYLTPGQELRINTSTRHFDRVVLERKPGAGRATGAEDHVVTPLTFERTNLATVFQRLSDHYKATILYDKAEVQGLSFTGAFEPSDELDLALKVICNINQLTFTKESDRIVIRKQ